LTNLSEIIFDEAPVSAVADVGIPSFSAWTIIGGMIDGTLRQG
jgi:hypothetical protein